MSEHIVKRHNKNLLLYLVLPLKYRRKAVTASVGNTLKAICQGIEERYEIFFLEIGYEEGHVHFLAQSVPTNCVDEIIRVIKSITAKELFKRHPEVKKKLWGGKFWNSGYYAKTVGQYGNEEIIRQYVEDQGKTYENIFEGQLKLF
ncbi:IS200/IS605 family transposase [Candidatus Bathyarchaeota archaeon]|nr:MAG: IS200/IS605 family transposase [Candidatus Bathyarchaeota archaeon]